MRRGLCPGFPSSTPLSFHSWAHLSHSSWPSAAPPCLSLPPLSHRYGGFSLGAPDTGLPSGHEVGRSLEELRALLRPQPGGALDRILNNLMAWAQGLDAQDCLKVGTGGSGQVASGGRPDFVTLTPWP